MIGFYIAHTLSASSNPEFLELLFIFPYIPIYLYYIVCVFFYAVLFLYIKAKLFFTGKCKK